jgi:2'-5' RNA ligase
MRSFVSFEFSKITIDKIAEIQSIIRKNSEFGRFKYIGNFHLTLKFLGEVEDKIINSIGEDISKATKDENSFLLNLKGIGAFGTGDIIKTIYINIEGEKEKLTRLVKKIDGVCQEYGFKTEKLYTPHITIAQEVKLTIPFESLKENLNYEFCKNIVFDRITIMKSEQIENKRKYTSLKTIYLM